MSDTIDSNLKEFLTRFEQKLDHLHKDVIDLKISNSRIEGEIKALDE